MNITGTFFEFRHHSGVEGTWYNPALRSFTDAQWEEMIRDIHALGMDTLVLMCSSLVYPDSCESYPPVTVFPKADMACSRPMDVLMETAEKLQIRSAITVFRPESMSVRRPLPGVGPQYTLTGGSFPISRTPFRITVSPSQGFPAALPYRRL